MQSVTQSGSRTEDRQDSGCPCVNVGEGERWASTVGGALLALYGLSGRGLFSNLVLPALGGMLVYRGVSGHCHLYGAMGVDTSEKHGERTAVEAGRGEKIEVSVFINRPPQDLYRFWRDLSQLPQVMSHLEEVRELDGRRSHWKSKVTMGMRVEWDAEIINDRPNEVIAWRSLPGSEINTAGSVHFVSAGAGRGTEVRVSLKYDPPGGKIGATIAGWVGASPEEQVREDLNRFKRLMEAGAITQSATRQPALSGAY